MYTTYNNVSYGTPLTVYILYLYDPFNECSQLNVHIFSELYEFTFTSFWYAKQKLSVKIIYP